MAARPSKPTAKRASVEGSGTGTGSKLMVAPATVPLPLDDEKMPLRVAVRLPVTSGRSETPRKLYRAGLMEPAMKLAEKDDWPGAPPERRVRLAFWKEPVKRFTIPLPRFPATVIAPPGLKMTRLGRSVDTEPVVQLIVPSVMPVLGVLASSCTEVKVDVKEKSRGKPERLQLDPMELAELKDRVSALAGKARKHTAAAKPNQQEILLLK
jgi:hypothetical protein